MVDKKLVDIARTLSNEFLEFINKAVTPFHVTNEASKILLTSGFTELVEQDNWKLSAGNS